MTATPIRARIGALAIGLVLGLALALTALGAAAEEPITITWSDLTPPLTPEEKAEVARAEAALREMMGGMAPAVGDFTQGPGPGMVDHTTALGLVGDGTKLVDDFDDKRVNMAGYMYPLETNEAGEVTVFILVPFVGACLHVPPPPPNQIVLVEADPAYPAKKMFEALLVTGVFSRSTSEIEESGAGYQIKAEKIVHYQQPE